MENSDPGFFIRFQLVEFIPRVATPPKFLFDETVQEYTLGTVEAVEGVQSVSPTAAVVRRSPVPSESNFLHQPGI